MPPKSSRASRRMVCPHCGGVFYGSHTDATASIKERFLARVEPQDNGCWFWIGRRRNDGYGSIEHDGQHYLAHRFGYIAFYGPIPEGLFVCHRCDDPRCVNPEHMFLGTQTDNMRDCSQKGRHPTRKTTAYLPRGEQQHLARLTDARVREIRARYAAGGVTQVELAAEFGVTQMTISTVVRRKTWAHVADS